ncbi:MAG: LacI family DNA-binding transcriptional regulator, partial [Verrucomicrobia bacterium]|nr:LacI family DNA-binding transcriptional regulator [Verrucomicrobiota bacterium]
MPRVTLKMIAKEAGVSVSTVSMALRGQGKFDKDNVARIRAA